MRSKLRGDCVVGETRALKTKDGSTIWRWIVKLEISGVALECIIPFDDAGMQDRCSRLAGADCVYEAAIGGSKSGPEFTILQLIQGDDLKLLSGGDTKPVQSSSGPSGKAV